MTRSTGWSTRRRIPSAVPTETEFQCEVAGFLSAHLMPPFLFWHTPNGGRMGKIRGALLKRMGVKPGIHDLFIFGRGRLYGLELKREKGGRVSDGQKKFHPDFVAAGGATEVCRTLDEVKAALAKWGIPLLVGARIGGDRIMISMRHSFDVVS